MGERNDAITHSELVEIIRCLNDRVSALDRNPNQSLAEMRADICMLTPFIDQASVQSAPLATPLLGLTWLNNLDPERLAIAYAGQGRNEFCFTNSPLRLVGATGAPAHPVAIFSDIRIAL